MRRVIRTGKWLIIVAGLMALSVVLFPKHAEPLWTWVNTTGMALGLDPLPAFANVQGHATLTLLGLTLGTVVYTLWRDRRYEVMQAEYAHQTGASHLKQKVRDLEQQLSLLKAERDAFQDKYNKLQQAHTAALVASKEYEVRSEYGREDREMLSTLRQQLVSLMKEKGHIEGFREAMEVLMTNLDQHPDRVAVHMRGASANTKQSDAERRPSLSYDRTF